MANCHNVDASKQDRKTGENYSERGNVFETRPSQPALQRPPGATCCGPKGGENVSFCHPGTLPEPTVRDVVMHIAFALDHVVTTRGR